MARVGAANSDLNELLGSDSDEGGVEEKKNELDELLGESDDEDEKQPPKDDLRDLLGSSDEEDANAEEKGGDNDAETDDFADRKSSQPTIDDFYGVSGKTGEQVDELERILGKVETKSTLKEQKLKTQSKLMMQATYHIPDSHSALFVRTPNFLKIQTAEYDQSLYDADAERKALDGSTAVVRWRYKRDDNGDVIIDADGKPVTESNARILRWADGSIQLVVGDAVFQCKNLAVDNCYIYEQRPVHVLPTEAEEMAASDTVLECIGGVQQRLVLQPMSLDSESHARMSMKISEKFKKEIKIRDRDYEQITEKPEKTLADLARQAEEADRRERKARERQYGYPGATGGNTITGAARFAAVRRPAMSADYLTGGYDLEDDEEAEAEERDYGRGRGSAKPAPAKKDKAKKKPVVMSDYLEYDEDEGSEAEEDEEEEEEEEEEDEEEEDEEAEEDETEEEDEGGDEGESDEEGARRRKKDKAASGSGSKRGDKEKGKDADRKERKKDKRERRRRKEEKRAAAREAKAEKKLKRKATRGSDDEEEEGGAAPRQERRPSPAAEGGAGNAEVQSDADGDEEVNVPQRKRIKRTIMDSDEDE